MPTRGDWRLDPEADLADGDVVEGGDPLPPLDPAQAEERAYRRAFDQGLRALATREHSRAELLRKLSGKGVPKSLAERVIDDLEARQYQSDARFGESFVNGRIQRGYGPVWIRQALAERGIKGEAADELLDRPRAFWFERATEVRQRKFGEAPPADRAEWQKQARFLAQRGFPTELVVRVLEN